MARTLWLLLQCAGAVGAQRTFKDDAGVTHTTSLEQPSIVIGVMDGISLVHFGLHHEQLMATYGERGTSGSNVNSVYADGNVNDHGDHANAAYDPAHWPADPTAAELAVLAQAMDLSPSCSGGNYWCAELDHTMLDESGWPDFLVQGAYATAYPITAEIQSNASANNVPIIVIDRVDPDTGLTRGFIEMVQRHEELAIFLGVSEVEGHTAADKQHLCAAVESFKHVAKEAHAKGVRAMATYAPYLVPTGSDKAGGWVYSPNYEMVLIMLEELGMPILHVDGYIEDVNHQFERLITADYAEGLMSASNLQSSGVSPVDYPVDFWLYDVRVSLDFTSPAFAAAWPHPAVAARQFAYWPNGGHVYSYLHAVEILTIVGNALAGAERIQPATACTPTDGAINGAAHRTDGLGPGEYACYSAVTYDWCAAHPDLHDNRVADWQVEAIAAGWIPCADKVAARKRKLAMLEGQGADPSLLKKGLEKLGYDDDVLEPKTKAEKERQASRRLSQKVASKVAADDDDERLSSEL